MTDSDGTARPAGKHKEAAATEEEQWTKEQETWLHTRLDRVQDSARVWLGVLTTLLGLLGSVVLFKGGDLITGVTASAAYQSALFWLVFAVFASAVLAVLAGGAATWGGLQVPAPQAETGNKPKRATSRHRNPGAACDGFCSMSSFGQRSFPGPAGRRH